MAEHFPKETPTGHVYEQPETLEAVVRWANDVAQGWLEHWDAAEMPPEPPKQWWDIITLALNAVATLEREREEDRQALRDFFEAGGDSISMPFCVCAYITTTLPFTHEEGCPVARAIAEENR